MEINEFVFHQYLEQLWWGVKRQAFDRRRARPCDTAEVPGNRVRYCGGSYPSWIKRFIRHFRKIVRRVANANS
ncbi:MAG: hypothetical protein HYY97_12380 [Rhodocyclales bacterium]|nr:hypothetical protein [Rhodocyclales bacterium]